MAAGEEARRQHRGEDRERRGGPWRSASGHLWERGGCWVVAASWRGRTSLGGTPHTDRAGRFMLHALCAKGNTKHSEPVRPARPSDSLGGLLRNSEARPWRRSTVVRKVESSCRRVQDIRGSNVGSSCKMDQHLGSARQGSGLHMNMSRKIK